MRIHADYREIRQTSTKLQSLSLDYETLFNRMVSQMNEMNAFWQGQDAQAFYGQLETVRPKMMQLKNAVDVYARLLAKNATAYETLQADRTASARLL